MGNKALKVLVFIGCFSFQGIAQSIPIQLMVVDSDGFEKVNHSVKLRLTLTNDTSNTTGQYQEVHLTQSNDFGIVSTSLGTGVPTTNSSILSLSQFSFTPDEPLISVEIDTSAGFNQYYKVGFIDYSYPIVARRALNADSADYSNLSINSEHADTAEFARSVNESFDGDTSSSNEIQGLELSSVGYLKLTKSTDSVYLHLTSSEGSLISNLKSNKSNEFCYQGNPEIFNLSCLDNYGYLKPQMVFDSIAYFSGRIGTGSTALWYLLKVDLYSNSILSNSLIGNSSVYDLLEIVQNDSVGYIMNSSTIYKINALGAYVDTITYSGISQYTDPIVFPNADLTWFNFISIYTYDRSNQTISSTLTTAALTTGYSVGNDSILVGNKIYSTSSGIVLKTYNITNSQSYTFRYNENSSRIVYRASDKWYSCDINGGDTKLFLTEPYQKQVYIYSATIEGMFVYKTPSTGTSANYNGYFTTAPSLNTSGTYGVEAICIDLNGDVYPVKKPQPSSSWNYEYMRKGLFTVSITSGAYCFGYNGLSGPWSMIRYYR